MDELEIGKEECFKKLDLSIDTDRSVLAPPIDHSHDEERFQSGSDYDIFIEQISSEIALQRLVAAKRIVKCSKSWDNDLLAAILPQIKQLSCDKEMIIRQTTAEALGDFSKYIHNKLETERAQNIILTQIIPIITEMLCDSMEVRQKAMKSLVCVSQIFNENNGKQLIRKHIVPIALRLSENISSHDSKITALHLIGSLSPIIGGEYTKEVFVSPLKTLSRDSSFRIRSVCAQQYGAVCGALSCLDSEKELLSSFLSLCSDSIWSVRNVCASALKNVSLSVSLSSRSRLVSVMISLLNDSSRWVRNSSYQNLGGFISSLSSSDLISRDLLSYFTCIPHLSSVMASADCTTHCAFNFPAVALAVGSARWSELNETYNVLCRASLKCRRTLSCSVHEIAGILGTQLTQEYLLQSIELFLKDVDCIRYGIVENLCKLLSVFCVELRIEYISTLWHLSSEPDSNWRFRLFLSQQLALIIRGKLYGFKELRSQIVPLMFALVEDRMADVRYAAVVAIADVMNELRDDNVITSTLETLYCARTYSKRLLFIRIGDCCFGRIDDELWNKVFCTNLNNYCNDCIANVRYCLARFIDSNKAALCNGKKQQMWRKTMRILRNDEEDVEIKRFFMDKEEIEQWLVGKQRERQVARESIANNNEKRLIISNETDSSIYCTSNSDDSDDSASDHDEKCIIMDNGSYLMKAGLDGDERPRVVRPSVAIKRGMITDIHLMESVCADLFFNELNVDPTQRNILLSEATLNPTSNRDKICKSIFETFDAKSCALVNEAVLSFYASGLMTGISCVIGDGLTQIIPISQGFALKHAAIRKDLGGDDVTKYLSKLLKHNYNLQIVRDIKHKLHNTNGGTSTQYTLPDDTIIDITDIIDCNNLLFDPNINHVNCAGIHQLLYESFTKCDSNQRSTIWSDHNHYWITGGQAHSSSFIKRIKHEVNALIPINLNTQLQLQTLPIHQKNCPISAFVGASILASTSNPLNDHQLWITAEEYDEIGTNVVYRKCNHLI